MFLDKRVSIFSEMEVVKKVENKVVNIVIQGFACTYFLFFFSFIAHWFPRKIIRAI